MIDMKLVASNDTMMRSVDIAGGERVFVSMTDYYKDYNLVFGEAQMRLCNTRYAVYLSVCMYACVLYQA